MVRVLSEYCLRNQRRNSNRIRKTDGGTDIVGTVKMVTDKFGVIQNRKDLCPELREMIQYRWKSR